jgi:hypothetical protein
MEVPNGAYELTAISNQQEVLKALAVTEQSSQLSMDLNSTAVTAYLNASKKDTIHMIRQEEILMVQSAIDRADDKLTSPDSSSEEKAMSLALLSIKEEIKKVSTNQQQMSLLDKDSMIETLTTKEVLETNVQKVSIQVLQRTGKNIHLPSSDNVMNMLSEHEVLGNSNILIQNIHITQIHTSQHTQTEVIHQHPDEQNILPNLVETLPVAQENITETEGNKTEGNDHQIDDEKTSERIPHSAIPELTISEANPHISTSNPIALWHFDHISPSLASDGSGHGSHGVILGAEPYEHGKFGQALYFDGIDDRVDIGNWTFPNSTTSLTISLWFKAVDFGISDARLISKATGTNNKEHVFMLSTIRHGTQHTLRARLKTRQGQVKELIAKHDVLANGQWVHAAMVYNNQELRIYQNRKLIASTPLQGSIAYEPLIPMSIGNQPQGGKAFHGKIDDVRIYHRALSITELSEIANHQYQAPRITMPETLIQNQPGERQLKAEVDHAPNDSSKISWSSIQGPSSISFDDPHAKQTKANFTEEGIYRLRVSTGKIPYLNHSESKVIVGAPLNNITLHHWDMNEPSGEIIADTIGGRSGVAIGTSYHEGKDGGSRYFNGFNDYIDLGNFDLKDKTEHFSLSAWIFPKSFDDSEGRIFSKAGSTAKNDHILMLSTYKTSKQVVLRARLKNHHGKVYELVAKNEGLTTFKWQHVMMSYNGEKLSLYLNGEEIASMDARGYLATDPNVDTRIGANPNGKKFFHGLIDDLRIFSRPLNTGEREWILE